MQEDDDVPSWTDDHHLVGTSLTRHLLVPTAEDNTSFEWGARSTALSRFQPAHQRKPALWRSYLEGGVSSTESSSSSSQKKAAPICMAVDSIAADLSSQRKEEEAADAATGGSNRNANPYLAPAVSLAHERYSSVVLDQIIREVLPDLIMLAALEEVTAGYLKKRQEMDVSGASTTAAAVPTASTASANKMQHPALYYSKHPNSYLVPPVTSASSSSKRPANIPVQFTPGMLVSRIKQGCTMAYGATDKGAVGRAGDRRSSSRLARPPAAAPSLDEIADRETLWKIMPGGKIAQYLHDRLVAVDAEQQTPVKAEPAPSSSTAAGSAENGKDNNNMAGGQKPIKTELAQASTPVPDATESSSKDQKTDTAESVAVATAQVKSENTEGEKPREFNGGASATDDNCETQSTNGEGDMDTTTDTACTAPDSPEKQLSSPPRYKPDPPESDDDDDDNNAEAAADEDSYMPDAEEEAEEDEPSADGGYVKEKLSVLKTELIEDEEAVPVAADDDEEDSDDEDFDLITDNPYLQPPRSEVLEWLGRKTAKYLASADLQHAFTDLVLFHPKKKKRKQPMSLGVSVDLASPLDQVVWRNVMPTLLDQNARLVLQCIIDEEPPQVMKWETSYFSRSPFTIKVRDDHTFVEATPSDLATVALMEFRERRNWDTQRFKDIHNGYTIWPLWQEAVEKWYAETYSGQSTSTATGDDQAATDGANVGSCSGALTVIQEEEEKDRAIAEALASEDVVDTGRSSRRTTRRGGDGGGVFYGNQSNMTQRQLTDAILRFISQNSFQTMASLLSAIPEESSDPLRRIRTALGRVLWKRNQVAKLNVQTDLTDRGISTDASGSSLLTIAEPPESEDQDVSTDDDNDLLKYIGSLHEVELGLRSLVMKHLTEFPTAVVAAAADERGGSMESLDSSEFEDSSTIEWQTTGHEYLKKRIFRPCTISEANGIPPCYWYHLSGYVPSIASEVEEPGTLEKPAIGNAKECESVERRMRFQATIDEESKEEATSGHLLVLTEAQVIAGLKAAEIEMNNSTSCDNCLAREVGGKITLLSSDKSVSPSFTAQIAGHNSASDKARGVTQRLLLLPQDGAPTKEAFWVALSESETGSMTGSIPGLGATYSVQQADYHAESEAFRECQGIVTYLKRHPKAAAFLEPVDPVALGVPTYFDVVKTPMDVSTVAQKLERGLYSNVSSSQSSGRSPVARMLNGPFKRDVELIFDNAMLFNPPDDWIHQAALAVKRAVLKKIAQTSNKTNSSENIYARKRSMYVDYDSDVDNYVYESDQDDEYVGERRGRKRKTSTRPAAKEEMCFRAMEGTVRIQKTLTESNGLRGPFADLPINTDPKSFSLPTHWTCRAASAQATATPSESNSSEVDDELNELVALHKQTEVSESANIRRSTRAAIYDTAPAESSTNNSTTNLSQFEYTSPNVIESENGLLRSRVDIELLLEKLHEEKYARQYYKRIGQIAAKNADSGVGLFSNGSFPPYLGRLLPTGGDPVWEIRVPFIVPALRWVIRGLIQSKHLTEVEPLNPDSMHSGAILANHVYHLDTSLKPCDVLNLREIQRRKKAGQEAEEESEDDVEMSEYEKLRAERVARNAGRLKALGLA